MNLPSALSPSPHWSTSLLFQQLEEHHILLTYTIRPMPHFHSFPYFWRKLALLSINQQTIFLINCLIMLLIEYQTITKKAYFISPKPTVVSSNCFFFYQTTGSKQKDIQFTIIYNKKKQLILTFESRIRKCIFAWFDMVTNPDPNFYSSNALMMVVLGDGHPEG